MKNILLINTANSGGGAEKVAYTLCKELHLRGYNSKMLARKINYDADPLARELAIPVPGNDLLYSVGNFLDDIFSTQYLFYLPSWAVPFMKIIRQADVLHMHNMHGYYFNLCTIPFLMWQKPVVWTFHDMWPFTGKCAWSFDCDRYTKSCGQCPQLSYYPALKHDTSRFHLYLKKFLYAKKKFAIVTPSAWLQSHVAKSILRDVPTYVIHSPIDTKLFYPENKQNARRRLGIPPDKKVILFIASWINTIPHKGVETFKEMLTQLYAERDDMYTVIVGHLQGKSVLEDKFLGKETGWVTDSDTLRACYASADVFVSPTLAENSSCTIMEAMACGTATVAYSTGGVPEQILHEKTGLLIPPGDKKLLLEAIRTILGNSGKCVAYGKEASKRAVENFTMDIFTDKYLKVYNEAIKMK
jgi:glycosyltransferase involved in cell wall biosynthesis